ncbi:MAG: alkaline phosphatase family protein [Microbacteriaceae bacterium]
MSRAVVVLVDGLGAAALAARAGHARTLAAGLGRASTMESGFPTTTAAALATLTTGTLPGQHGLVGYTVLDTINDRMIKQLSGWDDALDPQVWQRQPTIFERAIGAGHSSVAIASERYRATGFSAGVLRGAEFIAGSTISDRVERAIDWLATPGMTGIAYVYIPELDMAGHAHGWQSTQWTDRLETTDAAIRTLIQALGPRDGLIVTADHGVVDIPEHGHIFIDAQPELLEGVRFIAGEPRCLQLHFAADASPRVRAATTAAWREAESSRSWIATRDEAIDAGWFGDVAPHVAPRIGDLLVAARKNIAYYDSRVQHSSGAGMIGQHGSWSPAEVQVPILRFGAF